MIVQELGPSITNFAAWVDPLLLLAHDCNTKYRKGDDILAQELQDLFKAGIHKAIDHRSFFS